MRSDIIYIPEQVNPVSHFSDTEPTTSLPVRAINRRRLSLDDIVLLVERVVARAGKDHIGVGGRLVEDGKAGCIIGNVLVDLFSVREVAKAGHHNTLVFQDLNIQLDMDALNAVQHAMTANDHRVPWGMIPELMRLTPTQFNLRLADIKDQQRKQAAQEHNAMQLQKLDDVSFFEKMMQSELNVLIAQLQPLANKITAFTGFDAVLAEANAPVEERELVSA